MGGCWNGFGWGAWGGLGTVGLILNLVFFVGVLAVLGVGTVWLVRQIRGRPPAPAGRVDPLEIARRRLAAGEISLDQFEEIRSRIQG
ncbi:MAG: SHOCT domain-containing protein [Anaerolineae bacterium]